MENIDQKSTKKQYVKLAITILIWVLWMIWMRSYWMLIGLPIIFDIFISKKVKWNPFKQVKGEPKKKWKEWADALVFALVVSTVIKIFIFQLYAIPTGSLEKTLQIGDHLFVSKLSYGPNIPNTPISFPLVHNVLPATKSTNSYLDWIQWPYKRLAGFGKVERDDIVVFNFPVGDTIMVGYENPDYYQRVRMQGREYIHNNYEIKTRPLDKKENFVKRCNAIPGDTLQIIGTKVYRNGKLQKAYEGIEHNYIMKTNGDIINPKAFERLDIYQSDAGQIGGGQYMLPLTDQMVKDLKQFPSIVSVDRIIQPKGEYDAHIFPHNPKFAWNVDNFGPLVMPKAGMTIDLTEENIILYRRVISAYENNNYSEKADQIYIDGKHITKYTFKQDYYWMMGDNRHRSADSRAWGFVPEDHIVGKPILVFYSLHPEKSFPASMRWDRLFKVIGNE